MKASLAFAAAALFACSGRIETFSVSPDQKHVLIGHGESIRSVDVETLAEVAHASDVYPGVTAFSGDGSKALLLSNHRTVIVLPTAGGSQVDLGTTLVFPEFSPDGSRVTLLRNAGTCPGGMRFGCSELFIAPATGGEAIRVASGIRASISNDPARVISATLLDTYAFAGNDTLVFTNFEGALMWVPADGSAPPALLASGVESRFPGLPPIPPTFSRFYDGRVIVQDGTGLVLLDPRGGAPVRLVEGSSTYLLCARLGVSTLDVGCRPSAAGMLASYMFTGPTWTIQTIPLTGGTSFTVTAQPYSVYFDPDGGLVFFDPDGFLTVASPSGQIRQIGHPAIEGYRSGIAPDGTWMSFLKQRLNSGPCFNCDVLQLLSIGTAATWNLTGGGKEVFITGHAFSPDSSSILFLTHDRQLGVVPVTGGEPRLLQTDVDGASWVGADHVVMSRTRSSPAGVQILRVR